MAFNGKGFIIDVPKVLLQTSNGNSHLATAAQGTVTLGGEDVEIMGGWSFYNLARIDTKKTITISLTDTQWDLDALWLKSGGAKTTAASNYYYFGTPYTVDASAYTITLPHAAVANSVEINDFTEETDCATPAANTFVVSIGASTTTVTFDSSQAGQVLYPHYYVATASTTNILTVQTTDFALSGSAIIQFPLYSDADADDSTIIAYVQLEIYKVKIMPSDEFSGQYKQASQFKLDLEGLDPRRDDGNMYQLIVYEV
jgi:hypothetical protein